MTHMPHVENPTALLVGANRRRAHVPMAGPARCVTEPVRLRRISHALERVAKRDTAGTSFAQALPCIRAASGSGVTRADLSVSRVARVDDVNWRVGLSRYAVQQTARRSPRLAQEVSCAHGI